MIQSEAMTVKILITVALVLVGVGLYWFALRDALSMYRRK